MRIRHINRVVYDSNYTTNNIIEVVLRAYEAENDSQVRDLAYELKGRTELETCRNVWQYLLDNVRYVADGVDQKIKTPARLLYDGVGDCKSYSLLTACVLRELGIKHFFRFTSYDRRKEATHVYVVAVIDNKEIPIDAVAYVQARADFGTEIKYTYRADMSKIGKIMYLAGVAPSLGNTSDAVQEYLHGEAFNVWLDGEAENEITQAKGYLLSEWDKFWTLAAYASDDSERVEALNRLQYVGAMLRFYNEFREDAEMLERGGRVFDYLLQSAAFNSAETKASERDFFSDAQHETVLRLLENWEDLPTREFTQHWHDNVVAANEAYTDNSGRVLGVGEVRELASNIKRTGAYYLYSLGISDAEAISYNTTVRRVVQQTVLNRTKRVVNTMGDAQIHNLVYSGCTEVLKGNPSRVIKDMKAGRLNGPRVGDPVTIVTAIAGVVSIIGMIISWFKTSEVPSKQELQAGTFDPSDMGLPGNGGKSPGSKPEPKNNTSEAGMSWILPLLLAGGSLFAFMMKKEE